MMKRIQWKLMFVSEDFLWYLLATFLLRYNYSLLRWYAEDDPFWAASSGGGTLSMAVKSCLPNHNPFNQTYLYGFMHTCRCIHASMKAGACCNDRTIERNYNYWLGWKRATSASSPKLP